MLRAKQQVGRGDVVGAVALGHAVPTVAVGLNRVSPRAAAVVAVAILVAVVVAVAVVFAGVAAILWLQPTRITPPHLFPLACRAVNARLACFGRLGTPFL
eukprot:5063213-Pleurochrysis_carterae.AAC.1